MEVYRLLTEGARQACATRLVASMTMGVLISAVALADGGSPARIEPPDTLTAVAEHLAAGAGTKITIQVLHWPSAEANEEAIALLMTPSGLKPDVAKLPTCGYIWTEGPIGYAIKYARRDNQPAGHERIVLVTDKPLGMFDNPQWKDLLGNSVSQDVSTTVELSSYSNGSGSGRFSFVAPQVSSEASGKMVGINPSDKALGTLSRVHRQPIPYWATPPTKAMSRGSTRP